jgi:hypothetical protein
MKMTKFLHALLASVLCFSSMNVSHADEFDPAEFTIDNHAALVPVLEGVRRVRVSYLDKKKQWQIYSMAHLAGDEGQIKLRLPDGVSLAGIRVDFSFTDPFPYEVYAGSSDFVTEVDGTLSSFNTVDDRAGAAETQGDANAGAPPAVQESDLWKWQGKTLYFYNQLRGLQVFDFSDPANPERIDSIRMPALGEDMYLHPDGEHLILLAKRWTWGSSTVGSEAVVIRHSDDGLAITNRIPLPGNSVVESRMVGSHLYVAMQNSRRIEEMGEDDQLVVQWETGLTVEHTDLTDPANPVTSEPLNLLNTEGWWANATVSATSEYFIVAPYVYDWEERAYHSSIHLIDIRDQDAPLKIAASTELDGHLKDKFKLRIRDNILTCVTQGGSWRGGRKTVVANYDLSARNGEGKIPRLDYLTLAPQETLFATRFDGDRVYVVTAIQIDPLFVVDLSDDDNLRLLGELKIPGWSHYLQPRGDRLLSVGVEDRRVAISQFDVSDPENLGPPLRVYLGEEGSYSWSEGNYDEQAIGYFPDRGVMIVPYQSYSNDWSSSETALQILTFDDDSLEKAGVIKTDFAARRATLIGDDTLVSVSGREVNSLDVSELSEPRLLSSVEAAWTVDRVIPHGDYLLQIEAAGYYWYGSEDAQKVTLRVTSDEARDTVLAQLELAGGSLSGVELLGDYLHVLTTANEQYQTGEDQLAWRQVSYHHVVDLTDPTSLSAGEPARFTSRSLQSSYHGRQLKNGRIAWIPEVSGNYWGGWFIDFEYRGSWWYQQTSYTHVLIVNASDPSAPTLVTDYRIGPDTDGPENHDDDLTAIPNTTVSGIVEHENQIYVSFRQTKPSIVQEEDHHTYETEHKLRVVALTDNGDVSVAAAVSVPGTVEGIRAVGDDSGLLLLSSAPATQDGGEGRIWWSNDLVLQTSAFDGLTAFLIDEVTIPNAYHNSLQVTDRHFAVPSSIWNEVEVIQGVQFYPFDLTGEIGEGNLMELEFYPNTLEVESGILSASGWGSNQQVWWMLNPDTIDSPEPAVVETSNQFYANFDHASFDLDRLLVWVPVGVYGVETVDITPLFEEFARPKRSGKGRTKGVETTWVNIKLVPGNLIRVDGDDDLGPLAVDEIWRFQAVESVTYDDWMARQMGEENNPSFVVPSESDDYDGDGMSNWGEFAFGTNPTQADTGRMQIQRAVNGNQVEIAFDLPRGHQGASWDVQSSKKLMEWETENMINMSAEIVDLTTTRMVLRFAIAEQGEAAYFRLNFKR